MPEDLPPNENSAPNDESRCAETSQSQSRSSESDETKQPLELEDAGVQSLPKDQSAPSDEQIAARRQKAPPVDKTKLDMDALRDMAAATKAEQEERLRDELEHRPFEPLKPVLSVENYKPSARCSSSWANTDRSEKVSFCERCRLRVYDFDGMDKPEADELVFKMEGRKDVLLFKRPDGKFLTGNCPIGVRKKFINSAATAFGAATLIGLVGLLLTQPQTSSPGSSTKSVALQQSLTTKKHQIFNSPGSAKKSGVSASANSPEREPYANVVTLDDIAKYQRMHDPMSSSALPFPEQRQSNMPVSSDGSVSPISGLNEQQSIQNKVIDQSPGAHSSPPVSVELKQVDGTQSPNSELIAPAEMKDAAITNESAKTESQYIKTYR